MNIYTETHYYKTARIINYRLNNLAINGSDIPVDKIKIIAEEIRFFINNFMYEFSEDNELFDKKKFKKECYKNIKLSDKAFNAFSEIGFSFFPIPRLPKTIRQ